MARAILERLGHDAELVIAAMAPDTARDTTREALAYHRLLAEAGATSLRPGG
jgi:hypothetical protein